MKRLILFQVSAILVHFMGKVLVLGRSEAISME